MTNLFKRFFTHKSKFLLIIISLLGLAFSYSCSCRDNPVAPPPPTPEGNNVDPKFFTIYTNAVTNLLVQKADGTGFNYQPSIKFSEANNNGYKVDYEVTDNDTANKIEKANITYNEKDGLITFDKTAVLDKLSADTKKSITITFNISATNSNLSNSTTNFTLKVDLKKTQGTLTAQDKIGTTIKEIFSLAPDNYPFMLQFKTDATGTSITADASISGSNAGKGEKEFSKRNFVTALKNEIETKFKEKKISYKSIVLDSDASGGTGLWSFYFKFTFSDEDYDLTDDQKNGVDYTINVKIGSEKEPIDGTWVKFI